jgi:hypothetical protein
MSIMIIIVPIIVVVIATLIITPVIGAAILLVRARSLTNILLNLLIGLVSVCPLLHHREQVLD